MRQLLSPIYALSSVKILGLKLWLCKKSDKYEVWSWGGWQEGLESLQELPIFPPTFIPWFGPETFHHCSHLDFSPIFVLLFGFHCHNLTWETFNLSLFASVSIIAIIMGGFEFTQVQNIILFTVSDKLSWILSYQKIKQAVVQNVLQEKDEMVKSPRLLLRGI